MPKNLEGETGEDHSIELLRGVSDADRKKYYGKYVCYVPGSGQVIVFGDTYEEVAGKLREMGKAGSDVTFVARPDEEYILPAAA